MKRRVWRFLYGQNGTVVEVVPPGIGDASIADTEQISLSIGVDQNVTIRFVLGHRKVTGGAMLNAFGCNGFEPATAKTPPWDIGVASITLNDLETTYVPYPPLPYMATFKEALDSGVLEVPYQFNFTCNIG
jgi:hypothetical protein